MRNKIWMAGVVMLLLCGCDPMGDGDEKKTLNPGSYEYSVAISLEGAPTTLKFRELFASDHSYQDGIYLGGVLACETTEGKWSVDNSTIYLTSTRGRCIEESGIWGATESKGNTEQQAKEITSSSFQVFMTPPPSAEIAYGVKRGWVKFTRTGD